MLESRVSCAVIRYAVTGLWFLFAVVVGTLFRQTIEEFAADHGWGDILSDWWFGMIGLPFSWWLLLAFIALSGVAVTLWIDAA